MKRFMTHSLAVIGGFLLMCATVQPVQASMLVGGIPFDVDAFADVVLSSNFSSTSGDLKRASTIDGVLTGSNLDRYFDPDNSGEFAELGFTDNLVLNGSGADVAIFELMVAEHVNVSLTVGGTAVAVTTSYTGFKNSFNEKINVGFLDLSSLGIASGDTISSLVVNGGGKPEIAAVGALYSLPTTPTPEPGTMALLSTGLVGILGYGWRRRQANA